MTASPPSAHAALLRLSTIEMWERMSYYILTALLPLFLTAPLAAGGGGWDEGGALRFYGIYIACITVAPFFGGLVSDRWLGSSRALYAGAACMLLGHVALGISGLEGGVGTTFYTGLVLVAAGNGLFKPNISVLVGRLPYASPGARDAAFGTFWMFINIGSLVAIVLGGLVAERFGWHSAFGIAAFGMAVAISLMWVFGARYIAPYVTPPQGAGSGYAEVDWGFVAPFAVVFVVVAIFGVAYYQIFGALSLFTAKHIDRELFGLQIPTIWIVSLNPVFMLILMPIVSKNWSDGRGLAHAWSTTGKMALGFVLLALAFAVILGAVVSAGDNLASPLWIVAAVFLLTCAELMTGPIALAAVSRLAPAPIANLAMGGFSAAVGIGALLSGQVGALTVDYGIGFVFSVIIVGAILTAGILFLSRRWLARLDI